MHLFAETHPQSQQSVKCAQTAVSNVIMEPIRGQAVKAYPNIWSCFSHDFPNRTSGICGINFNFNAGP